MGRHIVHYTCISTAAKVERISLSNEEMQDSRDEIKLFVYGRTMSSMSAVWRLYGYQDYPAPHPPVFTIKVRNKAQLAEFEARQEVTDLQIILQPTTSSKQAQVR